MNNDSNMADSFTDSNTIDLGPDVITISSGAMGSVSTDNGWITGSTSIPITWHQNYSMSANSHSYNTVKIDNDGINMPSAADIKIGDISLKDSLEKIEERLAMLRPNPELEEKWQNLRDLRKAYMDLEAEIIEKEKMWEILKKP